MYTIFIILCLTKIFYESSFVNIIIIYYIIYIRIPSQISIILVPYPTSEPISDFIAPGEHKTQGYDLRRFRQVTWDPRTSLPEQGNKRASASTEPADRPRWLRLKSRSLFESCYFNSYLFIQTTQRTFEIRQLENVIMRLRRSSSIGCGFWIMLL